MPATVKDHISKKEHISKSTVRCLLALCLACLAAWAGAPAAHAGSTVTDAAERGVSKASILERLVAANYPEDAFRRGEVVVMLERPSRESLAALCRDFSSLLECVQEAAAAMMAGDPAAPAVRLRLLPGVDELEAARRLLSSPLVKMAEPNVVFRAAETVPDDPLYSQQWNLRGEYGVGAPAAWDLQRGSSDLTLAVVDTGMDYTHPDLAGRRIGGWDYYNGDSDPWDDNGHGTMVAGIACSNSDNGTGMAGLDWRARVMPLKALGANGEGSLDSVVNSIMHAANYDADVINMSLTSSTYSQELAYAVEYAHSRGCMMVAAVGNEGDSRINYPAGLAQVIGVGSTDLSGSRSYFSNHNSSVDLAAPGERIIGPVPGGRYERGSGTSEASPHVAAAALLLLAQFPAATADEIWQRLKSGARDMGTPGYDEYYGWGLLDVNASLRSPLVTITSPPEYSYPEAGKVAASAQASGASITHLELWVKGELVESYALPVPASSVTHSFESWDLSQLTAGASEITVRAVASGLTFSTYGEDAVTVYRNGSQPRPAHDWYLAEGTTAWGFEEYVLVQNPDPDPTAVLVTFMKPGGATQEHRFSMPAYSRLTVNVNSLVAASDVSTHVHADRPVVVERAMYWGGRTDGHSSAGANAPAHDWYLAEGTTAWGFEEYVLVQNPDPDPTAVLVTFMKPGGATQVHRFSMPAYSRLTVNVNSLVAASDVSTHVHADRPVVVERAMYWGGRTDGHSSAGANAPAHDWYLAEGTTAWGFEEYVLVQNPNPSPANLSFEFMKPDGSRVFYNYSAPPLSRYTLNVAEVVPGSDVSTSVTSDQPVIAERAMYWPRGPRSRAGGHCSEGSMTAANTWYLAEGTTAWGFQEYVLLANVSEEVAHVDLSFMGPNGSLHDLALEVGAKERRTVFVNEVDPERDASVLVRSDQPLVAERAMYWSDKEGGTCARGAFRP
ncbi:MAG: peptidase S8 [Actinobacteria bacterium]|nr:peptidase S8 [Actinomycetota bacterium]